MRISGPPQIVFPALIIVIVAGFYIAIKHGCRPPSGAPVPSMKEKPVDWLCENNHPFRVYDKEDERTCDVEGCGAKAYRATLFECHNGHRLYIWFKPIARQFRLAWQGYDWQITDELPATGCPICNAPLQPAPPTRAE